MEIQATNKTAVVAGIFTALGLIVFEVVKEATNQRITPILLPMVLVYVLLLCYHLITWKTIYIRIKIWTTGAF